MVTAVDSIAQLLFGKTRRAILAVLFSRPTERFHLRQIERMTGAGIGPVQRELKRLLATGLVTREKEGSLVFFGADRKSPVFEEIRGLVLKTMGAGDAILAALEPMRREITTAFIFGSVAGGREHRESDVDVLIVSNTLTLGRVVEALRPAETSIGREINPVIYSSAELKRRLRAKQSFLLRVMREPKVMLIGDADELG